MSFWNLRADRETPADGVLEIGGEIVPEGWGGQNAVEAKAFKAALAKVANVTVRINSPGGDVMAGSEIYSALREHSMNGKGKVTVEVTALAASAASVIAMAGDVVMMSPTAYMMIHNPWTVVMGDSHDLRHEAKVLDEIAEGIVNAYERKTGKTRDELRRMLDNETWMSAGTCVEEGFADGIIGDGANAAAMCRMDGSAYGADAIVRRFETLRSEKADEAPAVDPDAEKRQEIAARARAIAKAMECLR